MTPNGCLVTSNLSLVGLVAGLSVLVCFMLPMPPLQQE